MCTAVTYKTNNHYFGRNLDLECSYGEKIAVVPRNYPFEFRCKGDMPSHYAMIGMAAVIDSTPLFYDATNEKGLSMAGLNFPGTAVYPPEREGMDNIASFEIIPWLLGQCASIDEALPLLERMNIADIDFNESTPSTPLHWILSDSVRSLTIEPLADGLKIHENPIGVLTNNPTFDMHMFRLNDYMSISSEEPKNTFAESLELRRYSRGMGGLGLPGDLSSASRFVRAAFTKLNSVSGEGEEESISQFFHILGSVEHQRGCVRLGGGHYEITVYSSCCNTDKGVYYYKTYDNSCVTAVDMHRENLDAQQPVYYELQTKMRIEWQQKK